MALVAYDYGSDSEESDEESQENENKKSSTILIVKNSISNASVLSSPTTSKYEHVSDCEVPSTSKITETTFSSEVSDEYEDSLSNLSMFNKLPAKTEGLPNQFEITEDEVEDFIPKAKIVKQGREKIKISIPSLSDFDDLKDDKHVSKKFKPSKGSGLLSLLPPVTCVPMSNKSFVPNVLTHKKKAPSEQVKTTSKSLVPDSVRKNKSVIKTNVKNDDSENSDDDIDLPETFDEELWLKSCGKVTKKDIIVEEQIIQAPKVDLTPKVIEPYAGLDNEAFKKLVGKRSRMPRNIKLVDINEEALIGDKDLWMRKSLTDPEFVPKAPIEDPVDPTKRKKHHITYLAEQAKANEQELQNQWSSSKFNRNQTRAKYGF